ncbi:serine protease [Clavibacter sp. VKM Ac-2872]|uniref:trypsin-like serine peptidase n=1 Tax=Clavibacter sp. VKM Ac-2872 TaxID=2783812 RepID=UPI00188B882D|nr:serine protease [Clavibacter sp. VKM Ac-2872]MBF4624573.1 serine protease [Clavibacter sp. VKM Ac-2872]
MSPRPAPPLRRRAGAIAAVCLGAALVGGAAPASAADRDAPAADAASSLVSITVPAARDADAVAYWTPERRAAATEDEGDSSASAESSGGSDAVAASDAVASNDQAEQIPTVSHIGRIYYKQAGDGHWCSANVVASANGSTIATAGHCITMAQVFSIDMVFYPAYEDGGSDYGAWPVVGGYVTTGWYQRNDDDQAEDSAFMAVARNGDGATVESVVGASPVLFDQPASERVSAYGYPAVGRFDGEHLDRCTGQSSLYEPSRIVVTCDMTGGVSGGPILVGDSGDGAQFANVAERDETSTHNIGPLWQDSQHSAYDLTGAIAT